MSVGNFMHSYQLYVILYKCNLRDCKIGYFSDIKKYEYHLCILRERR